ncbi:MAG TPA: cytochrome c maturation protein CcmE [Candidatus Dormibacteraeota bacterium]|nr:cytochrome c maturation protein CcmE [Candidatus Dormibacteraeota bacterium]
MIRWLLVAGVVTACVGYLVYSASGGSSEYYLTVSELRSQQPATGDVRVAGVVQPDVQRSDGGLHVLFTEKDGTASIPVDYTGTLPDIFKPGITVVADGRLGKDGVFHARAVLAKCPSRFSTTAYTS